MKHYLKFILLLIFSATIYISCSDSSNPSSAIPFGDDFSYPLKVGNKWSYEREWHQFNFRTADMNPDPTRNDTTINSRIEVTIDREETLADSIKTYVLTTSENQEGRNHYSEHYFKNLEDGLYNFAYKGLSGSNSYPKISQNVWYQLKGVNYFSLRELSDAICNKSYQVAKINVDSLIIEDPPILTLKFPLSNEVQWNYRNNLFFKIDKKVIGKEFLTLPSGHYECYIIKWFYNLTSNGEWDDTYEIVDYISRKGLIKRTFIIKNVAISTAGNPNGIGLMDVKDEMILTGINF